MRLTLLEATVVITYPSKVLSFKTFIQTGRASFLSNKIFEKVHIVLVLRRSFLE